MWHLNVLVETKALALLRRAEFADLSDRTCSSVWRGS
jgi:hypothetical protein